MYAGGFYGRYDTKIIPTGVWSNVVYRVDPANNYLLTVLAGGRGSFATGFQDGDAATALFSQPTGVKVDTQGNIWMADDGNSAVREIILH